MEFVLVGSGDDRNVTVFVPGQAPLVAHSSHPNFGLIVETLVDPDTDVFAPEVTELFDIAQTISTRFEKLSERVSVKHGRIYLDGDEIHNSLTNQILRFLDDGLDDWRPLVAFFEKVQQNPQSHSRNQLFEWLDRHDFTITNAGDIVGYKGVRKTADNGYTSIHSGPAIVDGEQHNGKIPNAPGSIIEMPRNDVAFDPAVGCSTGLHVGTYDYASSFAEGAVLEVHVNPRDVVSVPVDSDAQKLRTCRYTVVDVIDTPYTQPLLFEDDEVDYDESPLEYSDDPSTHGVHDPIDADFSLPAVTSGEVHSLGHIPSY